MPRSIKVTTEDGKQHIVSTKYIASIEVVPGEPGEQGVLGTPDKAIIKMVDGDIFEVEQDARYTRGLW